MTYRLDRRRFLITGMLGVSAFAIPGFAATLDVGGGFTHSVASGEPGPESVLLWTRYAAANGDSATVRAEVSESADFAKVVAGGAVTTGPWRDWTAKVTVAGLQPGRRYFYRFVAPDGSRSPVGRTRTLPVGEAARFKVAVFSCSNMGFGWFNAYAHAAAQGDFDLAVHLGDYFYEYAPAGYAAATAVVGRAVPLPDRELIALADYRLRYASYRSDPDLQALHAQLPWVVQWDDHESANDSWEGGAGNHQPNEGDWSARKAAAMQAYREWMPVSETPWASYQIGALATLFRTESRLLARSRPAQLEAFSNEADPARAMAAFRDGAWRDPAATMLGSTQEAWLAAGLRASVKAGTRWQVTGFGTIMGQTRAPADAIDLLGARANPAATARLRAAALAGQIGLPSNLDNWGGYPAARSRFLHAAQAAEANLLVIAGDSHNAWAFDLAHDGRAAGVEFAGQSVTSPGFETYLGGDPTRIAAAMVGANPELKWMDASRRGYMALTLEPERATNAWVFVDTVRERSIRATVGHVATVRRGRNVMA